MIIGRFKPTHDGGFQGRLETIVLDVDLQLRPNPARSHPNQPQLIVYRGESDIGAAWVKEQAGQGGRPRLVVNVKVDDPTWPRPITFGIVPGERGASDFIAIWSRSPDPR